MLIAFWRGFVLKAANRDHGHRVESDILAQDNEFACRNDITARARRRCPIFAIFHCSVGAVDSSSRHLQARALIIVRVTLAAHPGEKTIFRVFGVAMRAAVAALIS